MQITQIIQYARMMVLHKGTLEGQFLMLLGKKAHFYQDTKAPPHSMYSHKYRARSGTAVKDGHSHRGSNLPGHWAREECQASHLLSLYTGYPCAIQR